MKNTNKYIFTLLIFFMIISIAGTVQAIPTQVINISAQKDMNSTDNTINHLPMRLDYITGEGSPTTTVIFMDNNPKLNISIDPNSAYNITFEVPKNGETHQYCIDNVCTKYMPWREYDINNNDLIEKLEALNAVADYFNNNILKQFALNVIGKYFTN